MKRGTVVWMDLSDTSPPDMGKVRPGIVVSGAAHNDVLNTVMIVPTSSIAPEIWPLRVAVGTFSGKESSHEHLARLDECLEAYLR